MADFIGKTRFAKFIWAFNSGAWTIFLVTDVSKGYAGSVAIDAAFIAFCVWCFCQATKED